MNNLYYEFMKKVITNNKKSQTCKFCILGDVNQTFLKFKGADSKYLPEADKHINNFEYMRCELSISYRLPTPITNILNNCIKIENKQIINSNDKTNKMLPQFVLSQEYSCTKKLLEFIKHKIKEYNESSKIFILLNSTLIKNKQNNKKQNQQYYSKY